MRTKPLHLKRYTLIGAFTSLLLFITCTFLSLHDAIPEYRALHSGMHRMQVLDRHGTPLNITYQNQWNLHEVRALHEIPEFLQNAFLTAEDRRFQQHGGIDWQARLSALWLNVRQGQARRGASTISEQVIRMLYPRPRTLWSRWLEGWDAEQLESQLSKPDILEFYLNQVPYARHWRGVTQAARGYFNRDLDTLSHKEMLALAVLVRAPSALDPKRAGASIRLEKSITQLAQAMQERRLISELDIRQLADEKLTLEAPQLPLDASHFVQYLRLHSPLETGTQIHSTLDAALQSRVQSLLNSRIQALRQKNLHNGAALVVDHTTGEVLAWVVAGDKKTPAREIDAVTSPRQPGSVLKPFLYAAALDKGWTAATLIDDAPLQDVIGQGLHSFRNYSRHYYGPISLREALGNSLNTPAVRTIAFVGVENYLRLLHDAGFTSLGAQSHRYDVGLALGNGEVSLLEMVQGYAALAHKGEFRPLRLSRSQTLSQEHSIFSAPAASLIGHILSDPYARQREFGTNSILNLPVQTAVKTGTSTDYRDAWAVGYNYRYVVGIWMGNLDQTPTDGVTGSTGPALALRSIFSQLNQHQSTRPLVLDRRLISRQLCMSTHPDAPDHCQQRNEYFLPDHPLENAPMTQPEPREAQIIRPSPALLMALDPRIPPQQQAFRFKVSSLPEGGSVEWFLDGSAIAKTDRADYLWPLQRGQHTLVALLSAADGALTKTTPVSFTVK
ncbi:MAG: transglycosylase domain-containing protein [Rickettsiales bacterium]|nr:transglycosylase domain-containing protein [Rickettsiales bacterium]